MNTISRITYSTTVFALAPFAFAQTVTPTDLGTLGGTGSIAFGINLQHTIVGQSNLSGGLLHAFLLKSGGSMKDLGTLYLDPTRPPGTSVAAGIGAGGSIVGTSEIDVVDPVTKRVNRYVHAFHYDGGKMNDVGTLGGTESFGQAISNGRAVGNSLIAGDATYHAFVIDAKTNTLTDLGTLPGGGISFGTAINRKGTVAGESQSSDGTTHAVIWVNKAIQDIGSLGGEFTQATAINDSGMLAGWGDVANGETHAWVGNLVDIGTLGGGLAGATAINNNGVVVGGSYTTGNAYHAFVWTSTHGMVDLNSLLAPGSTWVLLSANSISDDGVVVGVGNINGQLHAFSLTLPTTSPQESRWYSVSIL